jgi:hypothetical protein
MKEIKFKKGARERNKYERERDEGKEQIKQ